MHRVVQVRQFVPAPPEDIFAILTDPARHAEIDGSGTVAGEVFGDAPLQEGSRFGMRMRTFALSLPYRITNTVVEYEPDRLIAWRHWGGHRWRWELEPVDGGAQVTESFDYRRARSPLAIEVLGYPERNRRAMQATLDRLAALCAGRRSS